MKKKSTKINPFIIGDHSFLKPLSFLNSKKNIFLFCLSFCVISFAVGQTTVPYAEQTNYFNAAGFFTSSTSGASNQGTHQIGQYAHGGGTQQVAGWRQFKTAGNATAGTLRPLQVGDIFQISTSNCQVYGELGFSLLSSPTSRLNWNDRVNNAAISVNLDGPAYTPGYYGQWYARYFGTAINNGNMTSGIIASHTSGNFNSFTFTCTLTAANIMNVTVKDVTTGVTFNMYDLQLNSANPITDYSIYFDNDYDGGANQNAYWSSSSTTDNDNVTNGMLSYLGASNTSFAISNAIPNGLDAASTTIPSINALSKVGTGVVTLNAVNTYTGTTTLNAGTLQLGINNAIQPTSNVILNGGTLSTGSSTGFSDNLGTLAVTANDTIALGTGVHQLNFANSSAVSWTGGTVLSISGWTGTTGVSGTAGKVFIGTSASLTNAQLAKISFTGTYSNNQAQQLSTGEVVPSATLLPITLTNFELNGSIGNCLLKWQTASELNSNYFDVEKSIDGKSFISIAQITAANYSISPLNYIYSDASATSSNIVFYRLKTMSLDGNFSYSTTRSINNFNNTNSFSIYPNPGYGNFVITNKGATENVYLNVFTASGKQLLTTSGNLSTINAAFNMAMSKQAAGIYFVQFADKNNKSCISIIKK